MKRFKSYPIHQSLFYRLRNQRKLEAALKVPPGTFNKVNSLIVYNEFAIRKTNGGLRKISNPSNKLKAIQKHVLKYLTRIEKPTWLISQKGKSYIDNSRFHIKSTHVITIDIKDFYNNCRSDMVYRLFLEKFRMPPDIACILTKILTFKGTLPTGAPTSPIISYLAYQNMFEEINEVALKNKCIFSLYVDDMTLSSIMPIDNKIVFEINKILNLHGHHMNKSKIKHYCPKRCKLITGSTIDLSGNIRVSNKLRKKIVDGLDEVKNEDLNLKNERKLKSLISQINTARNIEPEIFPEIYRYVKSQIDSYSKY